MKNWAQFGVDHAYCVNLDRRSDRWDFFKNQITNLGLPIERFSAVDGSTLDLPAKLKPYVGAIGCKESHIAIYRKALAFGLDKIVVFEDDCAILGHEDRFKRFLASIPFNWKWFNAFEPNPEYPNVVEDFSYYRSSYAVNNTHCYGISKEFMRLMIEAHEKDRYPETRSIHVDMLINDIAIKNGIKCYSPRSPIVQNQEIQTDNHWGWPNKKLPVRTLQDEFECSILVVCGRCDREERFQEMSACEEFDFQIGDVFDVADRYTHVLWVKDASFPIRRLVNRFYHASRVHDCGVWSPVDRSKTDWYPTAESLSGWEWIQKSPKFVSNDVVGFKSELASLDLSHDNLGEVLGKAALELKMPIIADSKLSL